ncbi:hypothetical protein SAMN06269185_2607 [Natronoarchaeum philippinense]|uniref:DUF7344 domain-containing protein n=1 Tax=Natronoarchaeum philippinense TaxID=558529 RepID=A0A285P259_NATPI|nr:hypothetical protein [Natronoarchaeum philippinense]SNZ15815.1 hypothetical protein SAMN06269185_2607 [Natronoarchaeum philippinense]
MTKTADDLILEALANERRRRICKVLANTDRTALGVDRIAHRLATREEDSTTRSISKHAETLVVELHHVHLPKLDGAGIVEFDSDGGTVYCRDERVVGSVAAGRVPPEVGRTDPDES